MGRCLVCVPRRAEANLNAPGLPTVPVLTGLRIMLGVKLLAVGSLRNRFVGGRKLGGVVVRML